MTGEVTFYTPPMRSAVASSAEEGLRTRIRACEQMMALYEAGTFLHGHAKEARDQARRELADLAAGEAGMIEPSTAEETFIGTEPQLPEAA